MTDDNSNKNQNSRTQIILALIGLFGTIGGTVGVALIANWGTLFPHERTAPAIPSPLPSVTLLPSPWQFIGTAATGESIFVDSNSIRKSGDVIDFTYRIGGEVLVARADCDGDRWYVNKYDKWYSPSSQATQDMLSYVCR